MSRALLKKFLPRFLEISPALFAGSYWNTKVREEFHSIPDTLPPDISMAWITAISCTAKTRLASDQITKIINIILKIAGHGSVSDANRSNADDTNNDGKHRPSSKFSEWLLQSYLNGWKEWLNHETSEPLLLADLGKYTSQLDFFARNKHLLKSHNFSTDITRYTDPQDLYEQVIGPLHDNKEDVGNERLQSMVTNRHILLFKNTPALFVAAPLTPEGLRYLSNGTKWCFKGMGESGFNAYISNGPILIAKRSGEKKVAIQLCFQTSEDHMRDNPFSMAFLLDITNSSDKRLISTKWLEQNAAILDQILDLDLLAEKLITHATEASDEQKRFTAATLLRLGGMIGNPKIVEAVFKTGLGNQIKAIHETRYMNSIYVERLIQEACYYGYTASLKILKRHLGKHVMTAESYQGKQADFLDIWNYGLIAASENDKADIVEELIAMFPGKKWADLEKTIAKTKNDKIRNTLIRIHTAQFAPLDTDTKPPHTVTPKPPAPKTTDAADLYVANYS